MESECTWHSPKPIVLQQKQDAQRTAMDIGDILGCTSVSQIIPRTKQLKCRHCQLHYSRQIAWNLHKKATVQKLFDLGLIHELQFDFMYRHLSVGTLGQQGCRQFLRECSGGKKPCQSPGKCVFGHGLSSQGFVCVKIEYFFICVSAPGGRICVRGIFHV